jgi:phosphatidylserine/phosphatidylglycerophosphate/cardiolipin synthase-like enzyme
LDAYPPNTFADIIEDAQAHFTQVVVDINATPQRAILQIRAYYGFYRIFITELIDAHRRQYRYYVLYDQYVEAGFDNSPDPRALRLKYGQIGSQHAGEHIPHLHRANKTELLLTDEIHFRDFMAWLNQYLPLSKG